MNVKLSVTTCNVIRAEMARRRYPHHVLGPVIGLSPAGVSRRLTGHTPLSVDELERIAAFLGLDPRDLLQPRADQELGVSA